MLVLFIVIAEILGMVSAVDAVFNARTSQGAIAWTVALIAFPFVAVPAYWVFGRSKFQGFSEAYEDNRELVDDFLKNTLPQIQATFVEVQERIPEYEALKRLTRMGLSEHNKTQLLIDGEATYASMLQGISAAQDYILVEFYIVRDDGIGLIHVLV